MRIFWGRSPGEIDCSLFKANMSGNWAQVHVDFHVCEQGVSMHKRNNYLLILVFHSFCVDLAELFVKFFLFETRSASMQSKKVHFLS